MSIIINADDFGLNEHCSKAIAQTFREGLITDTTMMATGEYFDEAVELAKEQGFIDRIGVHLNLTEGEPLTEEIKRFPEFVTDDMFNKQYKRTKPLSKAAKDAIYIELTAQVEKIQNAGIQITHADSHHHIHTAIFIAPIVFQICKKYDITKIRLFRNIGKTYKTNRNVVDIFNRQLITQGFITTSYFAYVDDIILEDIPNNTEILLHPDYDVNGVLIDRRKTVNSFPVGTVFSDLDFLQNYSVGSYPLL